MPRPIPRNIAFGITGWDIDMNTNFAMVFATPFPILSVDDVLDLPSAASYDDCFALAPYNGEQRLYISNGTTWDLYDHVAANVPDSTATTVVDMVIDFNSLLSSLKTAGLMAST